MVFNLVYDKVTNACTLPIRGSKAKCMSELRLMIPIVLVLYKGRVCFTILNFQIDDINK